MFSYFDRFDVCAAYYHFSMLITRSKVSVGKSNLYQIQKSISKRLDRLQYKPGLSDSNLSTISDNAKRIYCNLVHYYIGVHSTNSKTNI